MPVMENPIWQNTINPMLTRLGTDLANHRKLADPWQRKAQSMARAWVNILRSGREDSSRERRPVPSTWPAAMTVMAVALAQRVYQQRTRTGWRRWASDRSQEASRWPRKFQTLRNRPLVAGDPAEACHPSPMAA